MSVVISEQKMAAVLAEFEAAMEGRPLVPGEPIVITPRYRAAARECLRIFREECPELGIR